MIEHLPSHADLLKQVSDLESEVRHLRGEVVRATTDSVTGLAGRGVFERALVTEHARSIRFGRPLGVIMMDVDHFKRVNDEHGHAAGDAVLRLVAQAASSHIREMDTIARYGGEEFVALVDNVQPARLAVLANRIRASVEAIDNPFLPCVTISLGTAILTSLDSDPWDAVKRADTALYSAKAGGRNRVEHQDKEIPR